MSRRLSDRQVAAEHDHHAVACCYCGALHSAAAACAGWLLVEHEGVEPGDYGRARQVARAAAINAAVAGADDPTDWFHLVDKADGRLAELLRETRARYEAWLAAEYPETSAAAE